MKKGEQKLIQSLLENEKTKLQREVAYINQTIIMNGSGRQTDVLTKTRSGKHKRINLIEKAIQSFQILTNERD